MTITISSALKRMTVGTVVAGSVGFAALGLGTGAASATTADHHDHRPSTVVTYRQTPVPTSIHRTDHRPFNFRGKTVNPVYSQSHRGWGFWFLGFWVPIV